ncbi:MAG: sulfatase, partial [Puniceicoccaceae bacterium]
SSEPFFLYLAFNAPHDPVQPPEEWLDVVIEREPGIDPKRARLVAFIEHLDARVGDVLDTLSSTGQDRDTLVVFTSDNGGALRFGANNGGLAGGKGDHLEGGIRVPMAVAWPDRIEPGSRSDNISLLMDLFPTICDVAGVSELPQLDGISLLPTLKGHDQVTDDRVLFWVRQEGNMLFGGHTYYAARYKNHKILQNTPWEPYAFYDLSADPQETTRLEPVGEAYTFLFRQLMKHIQETTVNN